MERPTASGDMSAHTHRQTRAHTHTHKHVAHARTHTDMHRSRLEKGDIKQTMWAIKLDVFKWTQAESFTIESLFLEQAKLDLVEHMKFVQL